MDWVCRCRVGRKGYRGWRRRCPNSYSRRHTPGGGAYSKYRCNPDRCWHQQDAKANQKWLLQHVEIHDRNSTVQGSHRNKSVFGKEEDVVHGVLHRAECAERHGVGCAEKHCSVPLAYGPRNPESAPPKRSEVDKNQRVCSCESCIGVASTPCRSI